MVKFQFLAQFPLNQLSHPAITRLIPFLLHSLHPFATSTYVINCFVFISKKNRHLLFIIIQNHLVWWSHWMGNSQQASFGLYLKYDEIYIYIYIYICVCVCVFLCVRACVHIYFLFCFFHVTALYMYIYIYIYIQGPNFYSGFATIQSIC